MISFRTKNNLFEEEWTNGSFSGDAEEALLSILGATLCRLDWEVEFSRDGDEWTRLGEDE